LVRGVSKNTVRKLWKNKKRRILAGVVTEF
jgi:hypothetical protein